MFEPPDHRYRVPLDGSFHLADAPQHPPDDSPRKAELKAGLRETRQRLAELQRMLFAHDHHSLLLIFQSMDAGGKDSTIRAVMTGVNPAGCQVHAFGPPSHEALNHDFLWRTVWRLPERGRIGIFNRSYYEEVLVTRVHPELLKAQHIPGMQPDQAFWEGRYEAIRDHERHLAREGTVILKFWLNVSAEKQRKRFLKRIDRPDKNWKFSAEDVAERRYWNEYMHAYEAALNATSRPWAPWYAIPADHKPYMRCQVADIVTRTLEALPLRYPELTGTQKAELARLRLELSTPGN
ncbi:polyphosphate kinase 2 family protein [Ectothiorhodospiraceae bacterium WFHF3C12]|nr:polyphosphate kinase 2 family protein [Ectothiorhodospiraceae bacterium WFHF3C12]